jgi:hypothetical protein
MAKVENNTNTCHCNRNSIMKDTLTVSEFNIQRSCAIALIIRITAKDQGCGHNIVPEGCMPGDMKHMQSQQQQQQRSPRQRS